MIDCVGIIYSTSQLVRRELIIPTFGYEELEAHKARMIPGESWLDVPMSIYCKCNSENDIDAYLASVVGPPVSDTCAVVAGNDIVVAVICADPIIDGHPDGVLISDDTVTTGDIYNFEGQQP